MGHITAIETFLNQHKNQLLASGVPEIYWEPLYKKLLTQTLDAGKSFQLVKVDYDEGRKPHEPLWGLQCTRDLDKNDSEHIYLIDHAWTYQPSEARAQLQYDSLRFRMANILGIDETLPTDQVIEGIFQNMWKVNCTYTIRNMEGTEQRPIWYIMDEIGCAVQHSDTPNCRIVPFVYLTDGMLYSILFLQENMEEGELASRDFAEGVRDPIIRKAALLPWRPESFEDIDVNPSIPGEDYFLSGHIPETLPDITKWSKIVLKKYFVFSQYSLVKKHLTDPRFEITENEDQAQILWYTEHFKDYKTLSESPEKFVNQFPYEYVLTVKDLLCITCRRYKNNTEKPSWLPVTYNLVNEIGNFVSYFQKREREGKDNYWIVKPYNLARGMDIHITNNLDYIMRLPATGPKIAQKYLTNPVLFYRPDSEGKVKFDLRYVILLHSVKPQLKVYLYKKFFLRFANRPFELSEFEDYEKHFTVMNYKENTDLKHLKCEDFIDEWQRQYEDHDWGMVEEKVKNMIKDIMICATTAPPPCGISESPQSRALYAADLMLDWQDNEIQPKILEINFMPDCERACKYYPDFYNHVFKLFLDEECDQFVRI